MQEIMCFMCQITVANQRNHFLLSLKSSQKDNHFNLGLSLGGQRPFRRFWPPPPPIFVFASLRLRLSSFLSLCVSFLRALSFAPPRFRSGAFCLEFWRSIEMGLL
ncbi:hypothetical protein N665_0486s0006 [Sinapis alba]|nr:hypothetical protein N665_0486s0006 [Sinapis alba]